MQTKIEKELREAIEAEDRSKTELRELLKEEKEIADGTRDRLTEICDTLRSQYTDNKSGQLSVVKETYHVEGMEDVVRYRAPTEQESREDRIKRGETTLKDAFLNNNFIKGITEAGKASSWVRDEDQGMTATLIRTLLGDRKNQNISKETEYIRGRENIANSLGDSQEKQTKEIVGAIEDLKDSIPTNEEKDVLSAQEKEDKAEELNLFQKQNRLLQGILDNTKGLIKGTNGLQAVKDSMNATAGSSLLDNVFDLYAMKKGGDLLKRIPETFKKGKTKIMEKGGEILSKGKSTVLEKGSSTINNTKSTILNKGSETVNNAKSTILNKSSDVLRNTKNTVSENMLKVGDVIQKSKTTGAMVLKRAGETIADTKTAVMNKSSGAINTAKSAISKGGEALQHAKSTVMEKGGEILSKGKSTFAGIFDKGKTIAEKAVTSNASKNVINTIKNGTQTAITKGGEFMAKNGATKIPIIGGLIAGGINAYSYSNTAEELEEKVKKGEITKTEAENQKTVAKGSAIGSTIGTVAGSAIGALGGPIGIAVGATVGEFLGDKIGGFIGGWFKDEEPKTEKKEPKPEKKEPEPPKEKTTHEKWVDYQEKLRSGEILKRFGRKYKLQHGMVDVNEYERRLEEETKNLSSLKKYKDLSESEITAMAKRNVFTGDTLTREINSQKYGVRKIANLTEDKLDEYNKKAKAEYDMSAAALNAIDGTAPKEYVPITMEDVKKAKEKLAVLNSEKGLETAEAERSKRIAQYKNNESDRLYQTKDKDGNVIGETLIRDGKEVYTVDKTQGMSETEISHTGKIGASASKGVFTNQQNANRLVVDDANEVGVKPKGEGFQLNANAEKQRKDELEKQKEVKVEVNNTNVQNVSQNSQDKPMYSQNTSPSYQRVFGGNEV